MLQQWPQTRPWWPRRGLCSRGRGRSRHGGRGRGRGQKVGWSKFRPEKTNQSLSAWLHFIFTGRVCAPTVGRCPPRFAPPSTETPPLARIYSHPRQNGRAVDAARQARPGLSSPAPLQPPRRLLDGRYLRGLQRGHGERQPPPRPPHLSSPLSRGAQRVAASPPWSRRAGRRSVAPSAMKNLPAEIIEAATI